MAQDERTGQVVRIPTDRETGKRRGFAFAKDDENGVEYFFHATGLRGGSRGFDHLREGDRVRYVVEPGAKGPRTADVTTI